MPKGFMYLAAIIDVHSRFIVGWSLSNSMEASWVTQTLQDAIAIYGEPEIINTDQGSQFTSDEFTGYVNELEETELSMDGKGRATDNAYIERFWRSIKYEYIYINPTENVMDLYKGTKEYIEYYNFEPRQRKLQNETPSNIYSEAA